jgi:hypothetical protein
VDDIAKHLGESKESIVRAMEAIIEPISLYEPVYNEGGDSIYVMDQISDTNSSDELWLENMRDLRYKLLEYKKYAGDWGTNVGYWFKKFYNLKRFKLGRLQFQLERSNVDYKNAVKVGDPVIYCHIPSSGPLNIEEVRDSFRKARVWFARELGDGATPIFCDSWLLYPPMYKRLTEKSNIRKFAELFDVFETRESPENRNFWRVFYRDYSPEVLDEIEPKTSLERAVIELIRDGNTVGVGHGAVIVDGNF